MPAEVLTQEANLERASGAPGRAGGHPRHQPELDGIRGLAILAILLTHATAVVAAVPDQGLSHWVVLMTTPLWGGVDLFFALSGFLITGILLRGRDRPGYFKTFYARRALRIFPIYYLFLLVSLLLCTRVPAIRAQIADSAASLPDSVVTKLSYFMYLQNIPVFWPSITVGLTGLWGAYWSLAVEEQFYLVWPTLVRWLRLNWLFYACVALVAAGPLFRLWLIRHVTGISMGLLHFPLSRLDGLFGGAALALLRQRRGLPLSLRWSLLWFALGATCLLGIGFLQPGEMTRPGVWMDTLGVSGFALGAVGLIGASQNNLPRLKQALSSKPLTALGKYSYGIYVYHLAVFFLFRGRRAAWLGTPAQHLARGYAMELAAIASTCCVAWLSYRYIEAPFLALKTRFPSAAGAS